MDTCENIRLLTFRLREDVDPEIGTTIPGKYEKRYYGISDVPSIEKCIENLINSKQEQEEYVEFDITIFGKLNGTLLALIALDLELWGSVYGLTYINPGDNPVRLLPRNN